MRIFPAEQGRTKVCGEAYYTYAAAGNPRRTQFSGEKAIYGWTLVNDRINIRKRNKMRKSITGSHTKFMNYLSVKIMEGDNLDDEDKKCG